MADIKAADVAKLRKMTGAGMMDCKKALIESKGDFELAIDTLRKKGQKVAAKRADREASEGAVIAKVSADSKSGALIVLNCETDFVAKNDDFIKFAKEIADIALDTKPSDLNGLKTASYKNNTLETEVTTQTGVIGEKVDLSFFAELKGEKVVAYIHAGNKLASLVAFNKAEVAEQVGKDIAMQVAAMNPISLQEKDVPQEVIDKEIEIGKELAMNEGKSEKLADRIARGKLNKFLKDSTLYNQQFVKNSKISISEYIKESDKDLEIVGFKRFALSN
ncbi:MAG: elongation factor Ts [Bacteroidales bacterium]|nr:elongation factor Ts [Bacteroidales bacterium]